MVGANAAKIAAGFGASVSILDVNLDRLRYLDDTMPANVNVLFSDRHMIREQLTLSDLVIGSVLIPGAKAPMLVRHEDLRLMKARQRIDRRCNRPRRLHRNQPTHYAS